MPSFAVVPHPMFSPTRCVSCGANKDPDGFIDLLVDDACQGFDESGDPRHDPNGVLPTIGHLYLCLTCLFQAAVAAGCLTPAQKLRVDQELSTLTGDLSALSAALEQERENKVVSLADVKELIKQRGGRPPKGAEASV